MGSQNQTQTNIMETLFILMTSGQHSSATRNEFVNGLTAKGATTEFLPSRQGNFEIVKVNGRPVARAFKSQAALIAHLANR